MKGLKSAGTFLEISQAIHLLLKYIRSSNTRVNEQLYFRSPRLKPRVNSHTNYVFLHFPQADIPASGRGHFILGDPGAVSGGGKKSERARKKFGRRKVKNERKKLRLRLFLCF